MVLRLTRRFALQFTKRLRKTVVPSRDVAGFVGKVAFFPVEVQGVDGGVRCTLRGRPLEVRHGAPGLVAGGRAALMARPESLRLGPPGEGLVDGRVTTNVYLGASLENATHCPSRMPSTRDTTCSMSCG